MNASLVGYHFFNYTALRNAPVLSMTFLVLAGAAEPGWPLATAAMLVTLGALVASGRLARKASHA